MILCRHCHGEMYPFLFEQKYILLEGKVCAKCGHLTYKKKVKAKIKAKVKQKEDPNAA